MIHTHTHTHKSN